MSYEADEYYIMSLKWTREGDLITWWRPKNSGYTWVLDQAGRYTKADVAANPGYYDNGYATIAVPCTEVDKVSVRMVLQEDLRDLAKKPLRAVMEGGDFECSSCGTTGSPTHLGFKVADKEHWCTHHDQACDCSYRDEDEGYVDNQYGQSHHLHCPKTSRCTCKNR